MSSASQTAKPRSAARPATASVESHPRATSASPSPAKATALSGAQLATAFNGKLEPRRLSIAYRIGLLAVAAMMVLLPIVYLGIIALAAWSTVWYAQHATAMFDGMRNVRAMLLLFVVYIAPIIAGGMLVLAMLTPLVWRPRRKGPKPFSVTRSQQPMLYAYIDTLCDAMRAPRPARIDIVAAATASAHIDNGLFGLVHRRLVLTIGLPLPATLTLRQFTGVVAHELGHFSQGSSMRASYLVHHVNGWFVRVGFGRTGADDLIDGMLSGGDEHWALLLIGGLCRMVVGIARLVLKAFAALSHLLTMSHSRAAEFDADYQAARIVGSQAMSDVLQALPATDFAFDAAVDRAQGGWNRKTLPDDLVRFSREIGRNLPTPLRQQLLDAHLGAETRWFDTHPRLFARVGALLKAKLSGVMKIDGPATCIFKDFDELSKMATLDLYMNVLGPHLQPEHLLPAEKFNAKLTGAK